VLRAPVYEAVQKTPLQKMDKLSRGWITLFW
jgi:hypothetical protein